MPPEKSIQVRLLLKRKLKWSSTRTLNGNCSASYSNMETKNTSADLNFLKVTKEEEQIPWPTTGITLEEENMASKN